MSESKSSAPDCEHCATAMKPLFQSWFCPMDCDKKPACPKCGSHNTAPFSGGWQAAHNSTCTHHCWSCGKTW